MRPKSFCRFIVFFMSFCALMAGPVPVVFAAEDSKLFFLSPAVSWYFPTDSKTRDAFGSTWGGLSVALNMEALKGGGFGSGNFRLYPYVGFYHADHGANDAFVVPVGLETRWSLSGAEFFHPYVGLGAAVVGVKFEDRAAGVDTGWRGAFGGRFMIGADITRWFNVQAAYNLVSDVEDYDMSGFSVQGKIKIYF